jgi:hypothetical protein
LVYNGYVYVEITKGMYGLPQAGRLANDLLAKRLAKHGYFQSPTTAGLWKHTSRPIQFTLIVDDFGLKYVGKEHALHLLDAIRQDYQCSTNSTGSLYADITLNWNYTNNTLRISMPGFVAALNKFQHHKPTKPQDSPYQAAPIQYGAHIQMTTNRNDPPCDKKQQKQIQKNIGTFLLRTSHRLHHECGPQLPHSKARPPPTPSIKLNSSSTM